MSREVSLYHGLPNGWQFRTDYPTAHAEFMKRKNEGTLNPPDTELGKKRPRIPSVAPLIGPDYVPHHDNISDEDLSLCTLSAVRHPTRDGTSGALSPDFQSFRNQLQAAFPIDPTLLAMACPLTNSPNNSVSASQQSSQLLYSELEDKDHDNVDKPVLCPKRNSGIRPFATPPALDLACLNSVDAIEAFLTHRNMSSHSQLCQTPLDSPTSSVGSSCSSQLSEFSTMTTSCLSAVTSALPTPVDEGGASLDGRMDNFGSELEDGAKRMGLTLSVSNVSMRAVCHEVV